MFGSSRTSYRSTRSPYYSNLWQITVRFICWVAPCSQAHSLTYLDKGKLNNDAEISMTKLVKHSNFDRSATKCGMSSILRFRLAAQTENQETVLILHRHPKTERKARPYLRTVNSFMPYSKSGSRKYTSPAILYSSTSSTLSYPNRLKEGLKLYCGSAFRQSKNRDCLLI